MYSIIPGHLITQGFANVLESVHADLWLTITFMVVGQYTCINSEE